MCGIAGILYFDREVICSELQLRGMRDVMEHRGPDDKGMLINRNAGIAHRRLSIIDLSSGAQPMRSADDRYCIVFNGEIYNYRELRKQLQAEKYLFSTNSDTEVILNLYIKHKEKCTDYLNGIFAFAILDRETNRLFLARDHLGIKPLYYHKNSDAIVFASEVKSIIASNLYSPRCNTDFLFEYLVFRHIAVRNTMFEGIETLPPGHRMSINGNKVVIEQFWSPYTVREKSQLSFDDAINEVESLLNDAVKLQMVSDVPLGTFCSGGIDSSLVTAIAAQNASESINTFSVGFYESDYDESSYAKSVSAMYGTRHHELKVDNKSFTDYLDKVIWHNDEPLNFANSVQIYAISNLAKNYVTVVLTGEGADEIFLGYPRYLVPGLAMKAKKIPGVFMNAVKFAHRYIKDHRVGKVLELYSQSLGDMLIFNNGSNPASIANQIDYNIGYNDFILRRGLLAQLPDSPSLSESAALLDQTTYLLSILNRQDKMSMAASIESRVPILDYRLVELANSLSASHKIKAFDTKHILKKVALRYLPREIVYRRKSGFGVPLASWMRDGDGLGGRLHEILESSLLTDRLQKSTLMELVTSHESGERNNSEILWPLLNLAVWSNCFNIN